MNRQLRFLAAGLLVCFALIFVQLNRMQVFDAEALNEHPGNNRPVVRDFARPRGQVITADGVVVARSDPTDDRWKYQRVYPTGDLFAHVVGYFSFTLGSTGIEREYNDVLAGRTAEQQFDLDSLADIFDDEANTGDVTLTLRADLQQAAKDALGDKEGSVVALDPRTGAVLALWSNPSFDPNALATHDVDAATEARKALLADPRKPLLANSYQERYMPGSSFKIVTTAAALATGTATPQSQYPPAREWTPPGTDNPIQNYGGTVCGGDLLEVFRRSCNIPFAQMAVFMGGEAMNSMAHAFGFNRDVPIDLPAPAQSYYPPADAFEFDAPKLAMTGFGQNDVSATPLQMALAAAAVANDGTIMRPHVVAETRETSGDLLDRTAAEAWLQPIGLDIAAWLQGAMVEVVRNGTARCCLQLASGAQAAAKTGTAQLGTDPPSSHAWITTFAPADDPRVVVSVFVKATPEVSAGTGGTVAGPIAKQVLDAALALPDPLATS